MVDQNAASGLPWITVPKGATCETVRERIETLGYSGMLDRFDSETANLNGKELAAAVGRWNISAVVFAEQQFKPVVAGGSGPASIRVAR